MSVISYRARHDLLVDALRRIYGERQENPPNEGTPEHTAWMALIADKAHEDANAKWAARSAEGPIGTALEDTTV